MSDKLLVINPGSTSTKLAVFEDEQEVFCETVRQLAQNSENHKDLLRKMGLGRLLTKQKKK